MRIGVVWERCPNAYYRAIEPMNALARRGHTIVWPADVEGDPDPRRLASCDVVHVYRRGRPQTRKVLRELARGGVAITYDNDDDLSAVPKESPSYEARGGLTAQRIFTETLTVARLASACSTTTETLAERYRGAGIDDVEVIGNYLGTGVPRPAQRHEGIVVGWVAGAEHQVDVVRIPIAAALRRLLETHEDVRVECIGVDLKLPERYTHDLTVEFEGLPRRIGGFDIGIAPLADIPYNRARSDIKLKEYAASGVPWLASPVGPYEGLGEREGGVLVPDDGWFAALDRLVSHRRQRRRLARKGRAWAKGQTVEAVAGQWEAFFSRAAESAPAKFRN